VALNSDSIINSGSVDTGEVLIFACI